MIPLLLALAAFHVPVGCAPQITMPNGAPANGVYFQGQIMLTQAVCDQLQFARQGYDGAGPEGALQTLGHELTHSYGVLNENGADCIGALLVGYVGRKLDVPEKVIRSAWRDQADARRAACTAWDRQHDAHG